MNFLKVIIFSFYLLGPTLALADLVEDMAQNSVSDEVVLDESFLTTTDWNEPIFESQGNQRDIATATQSGNIQDVDWFGELSVQREIPFTYPVVTRAWLQLKTLRELEAEEAQKRQ